MPRALQLDGCHQCRNTEPKEAMVADLVTENLVAVFRGVFEVVVHAVVPDSNTEKQQNIPSKTSFKVRKEMVRLIYQDLLMYMSYSNICVV